MHKYLLSFVLPVLIFLSCKEEKQDRQGTDIDFGHIRIEGGVISGVKEAESTIHVFKGIPFAAPPVRDLRWRAPAPVEPWEGINACTAFGPSAEQPFPEPFYVWSEEFLIPEKPIAEDCLYLNIWTPATKEDEKRPVLVWVHGGGFISGSGSVPIYDGMAMAEKGIVFVTINYRLGIFGFFSHPELTRESPFQASGNYGLMDQIAALKWVKEHIAAFGGDPGNITLAGQSAGSASVVYVAASPLANGLFQKAVAQSGAGLLSRNPGPESRAMNTLEQAEQLGVEVAAALQAGSLSELRALPAGELKKARFRPSPIVDGYVLPESAIGIYRKNRENKVDWLTGWNEDDGFVLGTVEKAGEFRQRIVKDWGTAAKELLDYYPATNDSVALESQTDLQRDLAFGAQNYTLANLLSSHGSKVYVYRFNREIPAGTGQISAAFHTGEVPYAYDNLQFVNRPFEAADHQLAGVMSGYWSNFITSGNPNGNGLPEWPQYSGASREIMNLGAQQEKGVIRDTMSLNFLGRLLGKD